MSSTRNPAKHHSDEHEPLANQADESKGRIKRAQRTDETMREKDAALGSEPRRHARK